MVSLRATGAVREAGLITDSAIKRIEDKVGFNTIPDKTPAFFAIAQKRLEPMLGPTTSVWYQDKTHRDYNVLKTGEIIAGEAVAVMHISTDKTFCYVQSASARGWVPYYDLLFTGHILWLEIVSPSDFAVVVAPRYNLMEKGHVYDYYMGDVIILDRKKSTFDRPYGLFPVKKEGVLAFESVELSNKHVHVGYLKATEENLKAQTKIYEKAFLENLEKDKSSYESLLMRSRVYRSIGVRLPSDENSQCRVMTLLPFFNNMQSEYLKPLNCQEEYYDFRPL